MLTSMFNQIKAHLPATMAAETVPLVVDDGQYEMN
jgi:hypothetical protein